MATGPEEAAEQGEKQGAKFTILSFDILHCKTCEKDALFARVKEAGTEKTYLFCSRCGEYTEVFEVSKN